MHVVILAGGRGTRLAEETRTRPKPMVEIGACPLLWHVMAFYASHGYRDFVVACGYPDEMIKEYFRNIVLHESDNRIDLRDRSMTVLNGSRRDWRAALVATGLDTMAGRRVRRLQPLLGNQTFLCTYGDGLSDVDIPLLVASMRERDPLERLAQDGGLRAFLHSGFPQPMDTRRERESLESRWTSGTAPWKNGT